MKQKCLQNDIILKFTVYALMLALAASPSVTVSHAHTHTHCDRHRHTHTRTQAAHQHTNIGRPPRHQPEAHRAAAVRNARAPPTSRAQQGSHWRIATRCGVLECVCVTVASCVRECRVNKYRGALVG